MVDAAALAEIYDAAFRARAPYLDIRPETEADRSFLNALFIAVSPVRDLLPPALLEQQAEAANANCYARFPKAAQRIVTRDGVPIGRIMLDWSAGDHTYGVDIAVLPEVTGQGVGSALLRAWLETADAAGLPCRFNVFVTNPARAIYAALGFITVGEDATEAFVQMTRPVGG